MPPYRTTHTLRGLLFAIAVVSLAGSLPPHTAQATAPRADYVADYRASAGVAATAAPSEQSVALSPAQRTALKADILANTDTLQAYTDGNLEQLAALYNAPASPSFWVWRTSVSRADIYTRQNDLPVAGAQTGFWDWTTYKNQGVAEQNAWTQMFMDDVANFSLVNVRDGIAKIFTGSAAANAQRDHCLAIGRRLSSRLEKLFAVGTGSTVSPATMTVEGAAPYTLFIGL